MDLIQRDTVTSYLKTIELVLIAGLLFVLPFTGLTTIKEVLFFLLMLSFAAERLLGHKKVNKISLPDKSLLFFIIASFIWALISLVTAIDLHYSLSEIITKMSKQFLLFFLSYLIVKEVPLNKVKWLFFSILASVTIMSVYACYQFYESPLFFTNRVQGFTGAFYRLATFIVLSIPVVIVLAFSLHGWLKRIILVLLPILFAALFFTFTRGAWIAAIIEILTLTVIFSIKYRKLFFLSVAAALLIVTGLSYKSVIPQKLITRGSEKPRIEAVKLSSEIIRKYPLTGIGYGKQTFSKYYPDTYVKHSHNIFINTAVETGLIGLMIFTAILSIIFKNFTHAIRDETVLDRRLLLSGIFASFIGFISLNVFDYMYHGWPGQMFWMFIGIGYALIRPDSETGGLSS